MKIVFSTDQIYLHGGLEKVMAQKANYFSEVLNYDVFILTTEQNNNKPCYTLSPKITLIDINVNYFRDVSFHNLSNLKKVYFHFKQWKKTIKDIKPDALIVCNLAFDFIWIPFLFSKTSKIKEYHSSRYFINESRKNASFLQKIKFKITDFIESKYDKIVVLNNDEKYFYKTKNVVVIENPVEKQDKISLLKNKIAIAAGRIVPVKNFEDLIDSWKIVALENPSFLLHIYGQGDDNYISELNIRIKNLNLENNVIIKHPSNNLIDVMLDYSVYVMTSHTECFPMVLLESLSIGLPIISFDCPTGPKNIVVDNVNGFLVENKNKKLLAEKISFILNDENIRLNFGKNALNSCEPFFIDSIMDQWKNILVRKK